MRVVLFIILLNLFPALAQAAEECHIDAEVWFTTGYEEMDKYLCVLEWRVVDIQYNPPLPGSGAKGTCQVIVELIGEDDWRIEELVTREDGNAQVWYAGAWHGMAEFEKWVLTGPCASNS